MDGNDYPFLLPGLGKDVVTSIDSGERPSTPLNDSSEFLSGNLFHRALVGIARKSICFRGKRSGVI